MPGLEAVDDVEDDDEATGAALDDTCVTYDSVNDSVSLKVNTYLVS